MFGIYFGIFVRVLDTCSMELGLVDDTTANSRGTVMVKRKGWRCRGDERHGTQ